MTKIQNDKLDKIKLQNHAYAKMDEAALRLYGLSNCRLSLVKRLRNNCYNLYIVAIIIAYATLITTYFIINDFYYDERVVEYLAMVEDSTSDCDKAQQVLLVTELVILILFTVDMIFHVIGYSLLYLHRA